MLRKATGVVKSYNCANGYGFLVNDQGTDVFIHHSVVPGPKHVKNRQLFPGDILDYLEATGTKGLYAETVYLLKRS